MCHILNHKIHNHRSAEKRATMIFDKESHAENDPGSEPRKAWSSIPIVGEFE